MASYLQVYFSACWEVPQKEAKKRLAEAAAHRFPESIFSFSYWCFPIFVQAPVEKVLQKKHAPARKEQGKEQGKEQDLEPALAAASPKVLSVPPGFFQVGNQLVPELQEAPSEDSDSSGEDQSDLKTAAGVKALQKHQDCFCMLLYRSDRLVF